MENDSNVKNYVTTKEKVYFGIMLFISILCYFLTFITIIGGLYLLIILLCLLFIQGIAIGSIRQNSVKITSEQFGDIYNKVIEYSHKLGLQKIPEVYLMQSGGMLNAFATRFLFKDIVVIYSDIMELAYEQGESAVNFIIAHELAHVKRKHLSKKKYIIFGEFVPFLGLAYSRACETTCDRIASKLSENFNVDGLVVLAAGKKLYKQVDVNLFLSNAAEERGFWSWFSEICSTHPHLSSRVKYLNDAEQRFMM